MPAFESISRVFNNTQTICSDLLKNLPTNTSPENTIGFLFCDSQLEYAALTTTLSQQLNFPIVGGTTLAFPLANAHEELSAKLLVYQKDGIELSVAVSKPLDENSGFTEMQELYNACIAGLKGQPKLFFVLAPKSGVMDEDLMITHILSFVGQVPVFGGMTGADLEIARPAVFAGGNAMQREVVLIGIGGNIKPALAVATQLTVNNSCCPVVTNSKDNTIFSVDDMTFFQYLRKSDIVPHEASEFGILELLNYSPVPVLLHGKLQEYDGVPEARPILTVDAAQESATLSSTVPIGTKINIGILQKNDILQSAEACVNLLKQRMLLQQNSGYIYDILFCLPCVSRYFAQAGGKDFESEFLINNLPKALPIGTFYGFSEVCPTFGENGEVHNRTHAESIVLCAF